ncbi:MAG: hypothetical protein AB7E76_08000 [Deferribacterales bacterium]
MKETVTLEDLQKVSYLNINELDSRFVMLQPCHHSNGKWEQWVPTSEGLIKLKTIDFISGCYFAKQPAGHKDVYIYFIEFLIKKALYKGSVHYFKGILEDIYNLSACINKLNVFHSVWLEDENMVTNQFVTSELEYLVKVSRSMYDLLQEIIVSTWSNIKFNDASLGHKKLPKSFAKMVYKNNQLSSAPEIAERYSLPALLAEFYYRNGTFFDWLKHFRDNIIHGGNNIDYIFMTNEGFALSIEKNPFKDLHIWEVTNVKPNGLGSVRALMAYIILNTINSLEDFANVIQHIIQFPPDIAPDYHVFIRGENIGVLNELYAYFYGDEWVK